MAQQVLPEGALMVFGDKIGERPRAAFPFGIALLNESLCEG